jgi:hypothetical protein
VAAQALEMAITEVERLFCAEPISRTRAVFEPRD